jgi:hypothetical protein
MKCQKFLVVFETLESDGTEIIKIELKLEVKILKKH